VRTGLLTSSAGSALPLLAGGSAADADVHADKPETK
jgi:hypothetical protein